MRIERQPRVLILGDSISIGYTPHVRQSLKDVAFVTRPMRNHRNAENCQGTKHGVQRIDQWLAMGGKPWDVIHFNFGLHDLKHVDAETGKNSNRAEDPQQSSPELYEKQLREMVVKLKRTGAHLIFATTTPVPEGVRPYRHPDAPSTYNDIARKIMDENQIEINDLFALANERLDEWQQPANVHFKPAGSEALAAEVAKRIRAALADRSQR